jgi:hypothetical protein
MSENKTPLSAFREAEFSNMDDDTLIEIREELMDYVEADTSEEFKDKFHKLLEVERELTLREGQ